MGLEKQKPIDTKEYMFRYFDQEYTCDEWVMKEILKNKGTENLAFKEDLERICEELNISYEKNASKAELFDLLIQNGFSSEQFAKRFSIGVGSRVYQDTFGITNADVKRLEKHGALTVVGKERFRSKGKDCYASRYDLMQLCKMSKEDIQALLEAYPKPEDRTVQEIIAEEKLETAQKLGKITLQDFAQVAKSNSKFIINVVDMPNERIHTDNLAGIPKEMLAYPVRSITAFGTHEFLIWIDKPNEEKDTPHS